MTCRTAAQGACGSVLPRIAPRSAGSTDPAAPDLFLLIGSRGKEPIQGVDVVLGGLGSASGIERLTHESLGQIAGLIAVSLTWLPMLPKSRRPAVAALEVVRSVAGVAGGILQRLRRLLERLSILSAAHRLLCAGFLVNRLVILAMLFFKAAVAISATRAGTQAPCRFSRASAADCTCVSNIWPVAARSDSGGLLGCRYLQAFTNSFRSSTASGTSRRSSAAFLHGPGRREPLRR